MPPTTNAHIRTPLRNAQFFFDDSWVAHSSYVQRIWHQARKYPDPVLRADKPWEYNAVVAYGSVLHHQGEFKMWYATWSRKTQPRICYAQSDDGVHWQKPQLGLYEFQGSKNNNIVMASNTEQGLIDDITVIDDSADRTWPLKALFWDSAPKGLGSNPGIYAARSKDGIHWQHMGLVLPNYGDRFNAFGRKFKGKYAALVRIANMMSVSDKGRVAHYIESRDLKHWTKPVPAVACDNEDPPHMEVYSVVPFEYEGLVMGTIERMFRSPDKLDSEVIWSRDGKQWQRSRTRPRFIEWGVDGRWDSDWINLTANDPIVMDNHLWFYYSGRSGAHHSPYPHNHGHIGLATLRIDGFCSLRALEDPGQITTKPMTWIDGDLLVNFDCRRDLSGHPVNIARGDFRVAVLDAAGKPIRGYTVDDCPIHRSNTGSNHNPSGYRHIRWGEKEKSLRKLKGRRICLQFLLRDAHLFSFKAGDAKVNN